MLVQLKCKTCNSKLKPEPNGKMFVCESCASRYIFADSEQSDIIDIKRVIAEGTEYVEKAAWYEARYCFNLYMRECGLPSYEAFLGWILSHNECRNIRQLAKVEHSRSFELPEWSTLLEIAGTDKQELLRAAADSRTRYDDKLDILFERHDAECVVADEVYIMATGQYREISTGEKLLKLCNDQDSFITFEQYCKTIVCTAEKITALHLEPALREVEGIVAPSEIILFVPNTGLINKERFLEDLFECHMNMGVNLVLAFVNDKAKLRRIAKYDRCDLVNLNVPGVGFGLDAAYIKGNRIALLGGRIQPVELKSSGETKTETNNTDSLEIGEEHMAERPLCQKCYAQLTPHANGKLYSCEECKTQYIVAGTPQNPQLAILDYLSYSTYEDEIMKLPEKEIFALTDRTTKALEWTKLKYQREREERLRKVTAESEAKIAEERKREETVDQRAAWIRGRRCRHCGGEFAGFLFKKCTSCGKNKDY